MLIFQFLNKKDRIICKKLKEVNKTINYLYLNKKFLNLNLGNFKLQISFYYSCLFIFRLIVYSLILNTFSSIIADFSEKIWAKFKYLTEIISFYVNSKAISDFIIKNMSISDFILREVKLIIKTSIFLSNIIQVNKYLLITSFYIINGKPLLMV